MSKMIAAILQNYTRPNSFGSRLRARRIKPLIKMIDDVYIRNGSCTILDIGGTKAYWNILTKDFLQSRKIQVHLLNIEDRNSGDASGDGEIFRYIRGDACDDLSYADFHFDICHSNSVIEHVGDWERMVSFAENVRRLAPRYFVQTPNYWFPIEPHCVTPFFQYMPKPFRLFLVQKFALGNWEKAKNVDEAVRIVESARLLNRAMMGSLFPDGRLTIERFFGLPKSIIAIRNM
jgi:SAM-dependent methyltransferase